MARILTTILAILIAQVISAQTISDEYTYLRQTSLFDTTEKMSLRIYEHNFFKNNEYFGDFVKGYTLAGYHFQPQLTYNFNSQLQFQFMWNVIKYHGYNNFSENKPYFRIIFRPTDSFTIIAGYLDGHVHHNLIEPIYNPERYYLTTYLDRYFTRNIENGLQLKLNRGRYTGELWLNWENFILWGDVDKERLSVGHHSQLRIINQPTFKADLIAQFLVSHRGGQIDSCEGQVQSLQNGAVGIDIHKLGTSDAAVFRQLSLRAMMVQYHALDGTDDLPWNDGYGTYIKANLRLWNFGLVAGHWYAHRYINFRGDPLYTCWALEDINNKENRSVIFNEIYFSKKYYNDIFTLRTGFNTWLDTNNGNLEYAYMLSMIINPKITLMRKKNMQ